MFDTATLAAELGAELAQLRVDGRERSVAELVALVERCQSLVNQATALQFLAMAHLAAIEDVELEDGTVAEQHRGLGHQRLDAPALVSEPLGLSDAAACGRMTLAVDVVTRVPAVHAAMAGGRLDGYRAGVVAEELREAPPEVCREVVTRIEGSLGTEPPAALRRRVRRVLGAVDADLVRARAARARAARSLRRWPGDEPGVDTWLGSFPVEQARSGWAVIDGLARQYVRDGRASGVDEARADALMDLIHSRATGTFVVQLAVPADRLAADGKTLREQGGGSLVSVAGLGIAGDTHVRREWLEQVIATERADRTESPRPHQPSHSPDSAHPTDSTSSVGATDSAGSTGFIDRPESLDSTGSSARSVATQRTRRDVVACHVDTGALLTVGRSRARGRPATTASPSYRPPPSLVDLVKARDGRCRFPGCTVSAVFCDLDHVRPWPSGPTEAGNLICLCRRHHRIKQTVRWRVRIEPDATVTWTDPAGRTRTTLPIDFLQLEGAEQCDGERGLDEHAPGQEHAQGREDEPERENEPGDEDAGPRLGQSVHRSPPGDQGPQVGGGRLPVVNDVLDEVDVLWSAWEDELAHHLARAERDQRRRRRPRFRVSRLYRGHGGARHRGGTGWGAMRARRASADDPPPF